MTACPRQAHLTAVGVVGGTGGLYNESYTYDATTGNLSSKAGVSYGYQDSSHFHAVTHLDSVQKYWYDANGNMTERNVGSDSYELIYDADNRLVAVEKNQTTVGEYTYDGDGNRVKSVAGGVTTYYIGNTYEWRVETSGSTGVEYYYAGSQRVAMRVGTTLSYLFGDHLGSTSITTDASGSLSGELRYLPFGETRYSNGQTPTSFRYTGQREEAEVGLYFYGARWYDPYLNRWIQPDSIVPDPYNPQDFDRYSYVRNNPVRYSDPSGRFTEDEIDKYLISIGIDDVDERAKIVAQWKGDDGWWDVLEGATYGDVIDGTKLLLGEPYGERIVLQFTQNDEAGTFGIQGNDILWDVGELGVGSSESLNNSNYSLIEFHDETSDIIWMRPNSKGELTYQDGTGYGGDGANVQWGELWSTIGNSATALVDGIGGIALLVAPVPGSQILGVAAFIGYGYELSQVRNSANNFSRSCDAADRLRLDLVDSMFVP